MKPCCKTTKVSQEEVFRLDLQHPGECQKIIYTICPICGTKTERQEKEEG